MGQVQFSVTIAVVVFSEETYRATSSCFCWACPEKLGSMISGSRDIYVLIGLVFALEGSCTKAVSTLLGCL